MENRKVGIGLIGCGRIARAHFNAYNNAKDLTTLVAVVDIDSERAKKGQQESGAKKYYLSVFELIMDDEVEAVDICLPHALHCDIAVQALKAKRHVLVEKPMACSLEECDRMIAAAEANGVWLMSGQSRRFNYPLIKARELIEEGKIGEIIRLHFAQVEKVTELATPWWGTEGAGPSWEVYAWGSHTVDQMIYLCGKRPVRVYAQGFSRNKLVYGVDEIIATVTFEGNIIGVHLFSCVAGGPDGVNAVIGTEGYLQLSGGKVILNGSAVPNVKENVNDFTAEIREYATAILENREPWTSGQKVRDVYAVLDAIMRSIETNQSISLSG